MRNFEYIYPKDAKSIPVLLSKTEGESILFAGGTDAISRMKEGLVQPKQLVNLKAVPELNFIEEKKDGLHIGATTKLAELIDSTAVIKYPGLLEAARSIATPQLRNMGTVGGNLCQRPRCWYYRSRHFPCLRKGGDICYAVNGENKYHAILGGEPCFIVHPSDLAPMLITLDAKVTIRGPKKERKLSLAEFYVLPEEDVLHETVLTPQEILTEVIIPKPVGISHYLKFRERRSFDFAMVSVAVAAKVSAKKTSNVRIVYGGVAPKPWRARAAEQVLEGQTVNDGLLEKAGNAEMNEVVTLEKNEYKVILAKNLLKKTVRDLMAG